MASLNDVQGVLKEVEDFVIETREQLEEFKRTFIKGKIQAFFSEMRNVAPEDKKTFGAAINNLKNVAQDKLKKHQATIGRPKKKSAQGAVDTTLPVIPHTLGTVHPLTLTRNRIVEIFERIGFNVSEGPEVEDDWHNFTALNFPHNHPAREMQDTFFIEKQGQGEDKNDDIALRTHTSSVQIRVMENQDPPIRTLSPGRVFRNEAISARAHCIFHQVEGLYIDENVSFTDLKQTLYHFAKEMFGKNTKIRLRPSYFPFTEPSAEVDVTCFICGGKGCNICKYSGWVEIMGCGMVDPNVLANCNIDPEKYTGFAFGMGIERIAMLKYQVNDLRLFTENDVRFLRQFGKM